MIVADPVVSALYTNLSSCACCRSAQVWFRILICCSNSTIRDFRDSIVASQMPELQLLFGDRLGGTGWGQTGGGSSLEKRMKNVAYLSVREEVIADFFSDK